MSLLSEVKVAIRLTIVDEGLDNQISQAILSAKDDLTNTADIDSAYLSSEDDIPPMIRQAIITYASAEWYRNTNPDLAEKLMKSYDSIKTKLMMSSAYSTYS